MIHILNPQHLSRFHALSKTQLSFISLTIQDLIMINNVLAFDYNGLVYF